MKQDQQEERQKRDGREIERHRDRLVILPVQEMRRGVEADKGQTEHRERAGEAIDRLVPPVGGEVEQAAAHEQERADVQRDLRVRQRPALDNPVVLARVERAVGGVQPVRLVRVDQPQAQPLADVIEVRPDA